MGIVMELFENGNFPRGLLKGVQSLSKYSEKGVESCLLMGVASQ